MMVKSHTIYFSLSLLLFAAAIVYGIFQFNILQAERLATNDNQTSIAVVESSIKETRTSYATTASEYAAQETEFRKKLESILPHDENYTELTQRLDAYFAEHDRPGNPVFQGSLRYGKGMPVKDFPGISELPISMNLEGSRDNFYRFLEFVKNSGSLENGIRLLEIKNVSLNFPEDGEIVKDPTQKLSVNLEMVAYYRTPKIPR